MKVYIKEMYHTVSGEVGLFPQGAPVLVVRFAGCNLNCSYCDTKYARVQDEQDLMEISEVVDAIRDSYCTNILFTGGEPLLQADALEQIIQNLPFDCITQVETNGSLPLDVKKVDCWVVDHKLDGSSCRKAMMSPRSLVNNAASLFFQTEASMYVKFVCTNRQDYEDACVVMRDIQARLITERQSDRIAFAMSAVEDCLPSSTLLSWLIEDKKADVILNIQIHKTAKLDGERCVNTDTMPDKGGGKTWNERLPIELKKGSLSTL